MKAPDGAVVGIYYDSPRDVVEGDALVTPTGRAYVVVSLRRQTRGKHVGRWHLRCLVAPAEQLADDVVRHPIRWYRRERRSR